MRELENFDTMQVVKGRRDNKRLKSELKVCQHGLNATVAPTQAPYGKSHSQMSLNVYFVH